MGLAWAQNNLPRCWITCSAQHPSPLMGAATGRPTASNGSPRRRTITLSAGPLHRRPLEPCQAGPSPGSSSPKLHEKRRPPTSLGAAGPCPPTAKPFRPRCGAGEGSTSRRRPGRALCQAQPAAALGPLEDTILHHPFVPNLNDIPAIEP